MWSIGEVKQNGWNNLKNYYWAAFFVSLITGFLGFEGGSSTATSQSVNRNRTEVTDYISGNIPGSDIRLSGNMNTMVASIIIMAVIVIILLAAVFKVFIGNPVLVGGCRFYMESRALQQSAGVGRVFWVFKSGSYLNVVKIMFLRDLYTFLWGLLLVIPGIIKSYEYLMIPYILSENPEADSRDVFALTKDMMDNYKFQYFVLELSFIGWIILGLLTCGISLFFTIPYMEATSAEVYACCRKNMGGFPFNGYGVPERQSVYDQVYESGEMIDI